MKEGVASAIRGLNPTTQIVPPLNYVDGLIADNPLEDVGGRRPGDTVHRQEAAVEPRIEEVHEIIVDAGELGFVCTVIEEVLPQRDQGARAAWRKVQPAEQLLTWRLNDAEQPLQVLRGGRVVVIAAGGA